MEVNRDYYIDKTNPITGTYKCCMKQEIQGGVNRKYGKLTLAYAERRQAFRNDVSRQCSGWTLLFFRKQCKEKTLLLPLTGQLPASSFPWMWKEKWKEIN